MRYRVFGKTGKEVSVLGFGGMRFTEDDDEAIATVRRAVELGVNYFDTAPGYCADRSEDLIGRALEGIRDVESGKAFLSTKTHISRDATASEVRKRLETSLERFRTDRIEFYQIWNIQTWEQFEKVTAAGGPYEGARKAKEEGLIHHICFSTHAPGDVIRRIIETGLFEGVTMGYNVINAPFRREGIDAAREAGIGAVSMNSLAGGLIPQGRDFFSKAALAGQSLIATALRHNIATPGLTIALSGMGTIAQVEENVAAVEMETVPNENTVREIQATFESLGEKFCTGCGYCLPCPSGVPIHVYMKAFDLERAAGTQEAEKYFRDALPWIKKNPDYSKPAAECDQCGKCEELCTQNLAVMERMKEAAKYDRLLDE